MNSLLEIIPDGSILPLYLESRNILETPVSYDLAVAISVIGAGLKRSCWIDQEAFRIYPNISSLLVGHSGIGKDTAIDGGEAIIQNLGLCKIIGGRTSETILEALYQLGDPAVAVIMAGEFSEFFGPKDYQKGMMEVITEVMSTKAYKDISLKSTGERRIMKPTLTMLGGSTKEWLHTAMPEHAMSGGFYPRFLIVCEDQTKRTVPWVRYSISEQERDAAKGAKEAFYTGLRDALGVCSAIGEMVPREGAIEAYERFYNERMGLFSSQASPYAHRCRDHVLRIAMVSAVCRYRQYIDRHDIEFAAQFMGYLGQRIDDALAPPTVHARIHKEVLKLLPATRSYIWRILAKRYSVNDLERVLKSMEHEEKLITRATGNDVYRLVQDVSEQSTHIFRSDSRQRNRASSL